MTQMQEKNGIICIDEYLSGICAQKERELSLAYLSHLQRQHVISIQYHNLNLLNGEKISLELEHLYQKLVLQKRGGLCFELNYLFCELLSELGFKVTVCGARVYTPQLPDIWFKEDAHMILLVELSEKQFVVDVGFKHLSPKCPVPLDGTTVSDENGSYRIRTEPALGELNMVLEWDNNDTWVYLYKFKLEAKNANQFKGPIDFVENSPNCKFTMGYFLSKITESERWGLCGNVLVHHAGRTKTTAFVPDAELKDTAKLHFDLC